MPVSIVQSSVLDIFASLQKSEFTQNFGYKWGGIQKLVGNEIEDKVVWCLIQTLKNSESKK